METCKESRIVSIFVGKQYSSRHKIPFDRVQSKYTTEDYGAILDVVYDHTDMQSVSNGESLHVAMWCVLQYLKEQENWTILVRDQKTIMRMLQA